MRARSPSVVFSNVRSRWQCVTVNLILTTAAAAELRVDGHVCELQLMHAALLDPPQVGWEAGIERSSRRNESHTCNDDDDDNDGDCL
jgi:hypothetical protein